MDGSLTLDHYLRNQYDTWQDSERDLFGDPVAVAPVARPTEIFSAESAGRFSWGERCLIASRMVEKSADLFSFGQREKMLMESDRFAACGRDDMKFYCRECQSTFRVRMSCRSRVCPECQAVYVKKLKKKMLPVISRTVANQKRGYRLSLVTLTVTSRRFGDALPDRDGIKRLYAETSKFMRLHYGKFKCHLSKAGNVIENRKRWLGAGWVAVLEFGNDNNNAHCHLVVYGPIRQWHGLKASWQAITGDSHGVDIRVIRQPDKAIAYVLKYISKPPQTDSYDRIADYAAAIKGSRRVRSGGIFYNAFTPERPEGLGFHCAICAGMLIPDGLIPSDQGLDIPGLFESLRSVSDLTHCKAIYAPQGANSCKQVAKRCDIPPAWRPEPAFSVLPLQLILPKLKVS